MLFGDIEETLKDMQKRLKNLIRIWEFLWKT